MHRQIGRQLAAIMFADMVGFTALMQEDEQLGLEKRARYSRVLEALHETFGGRIVQYYGDGAVSIFPNSVDAVLCAVEIQKELGRPLEVQVRIGLHVGNVIVEPTGLIGDAVNIASRIESFSLPGGVLVSDSVHDQIKNQPQLGFVNLGKFKLKNVQRPFEIFAVSTGGLAVPPMGFLEGTGERVVGLPDNLVGSGVANLPTQLTSFVGRAAELAAVEELLTDARLVTLTGPGGSGKTRLGLEAALKLAAGFPDGAWLVELARVSDPARVPQAIADALGIRISAGGDVVATLCTSLETQAALIVLDNFEHVIKSAPLVSTLLEAAPDSRVLVTSRERLRLSGERLYRVPPLDSADAADLFALRAQAVRPEFDPTGDNSGDISAICEDLDGLPLAIELAAARVDVLPPAALRERLRARLATLTGGMRDRPARQQTLRNTIDWSYELLDPQEQRLFVSLAVFSGGHSLEAVEAVCGPDLTLGVLDGLQSITDKSLVSQRTGPDGRPRFFLLETIQEYTRQLLGENSGTKAIRQRHCDFFVDFSERAAPKALYGADSDRWWAMLHADLDNVRSALAWAFTEGDPLQGCRLLGALHFFWFHGAWRELETWGPEALRQADALEPSARARLHLALGRIGRGRHHPIEDAREHYEDAAEWAQVAGDRRISADAMCRLATTYAGDRGNYDRAVGLCRLALDEARSVDEPRLAAQALNAMGELARSLRDGEVAARAYQQALQISREAGDEGFAAMVLANLSFIARHRGDHQTAEHLAAEALRAGLELQPQSLTAWGLGAVALAATGAGRTYRGARLLSAADRVFETMGVTPTPADQPEYDRARARLADELEPTELDALMAEGRAMTRDQAVAYALEENAT